MIELTPLQYRLGVYAYIVISFIVVAASATVNPYAVIFVFWSLLLYPSLLLLNTLFSKIHSGGVYKVGRIEITYFVSLLIIIALISWPSCLLLNVVVGSPWQCNPDKGNEVAAVLEFIFARLVVLNYVSIVVYAVFKPIMTRLGASKVNA